MWCKPMNIIRATQKKMMSKPVTSTLVGYHFARSALRSGRPLCYEFHAADLLDLASDGIDPRMDRHPGMRLSLAAKRAALRDVLAAIARERRVLTYRQAMEEGMAA